MNEKRILNLWLLHCPSYQFCISSFDVTKRREFGLCHMPLMIIV